MDRIILKGIDCRGRLGVTAEERSKEQVLKVDLTLFLDLEAAAHTDDLSLSVDYSRVVERVRELVAASSLCLLEALAESLARSLLQEFPLQGLILRLHKFPPSLRSRLEDVSVELRRGSGWES